MIIGLLIIIPIIVIAFAISIIVVKINRIKNVVTNETISYIVNNADELMNGEMQEKSVSGMTKILLPKIREDLGDFNETILYQNVEEDLLKILNSIEDKRKIESSKLDIVSNAVNEKILDLKNSNKDLEFNDVKFNRHAIKDYVKKGGIATITISTSLSYLNEKDIRIQTRYECKYVYIFDYSKYLKDNKEIIFITHCPNCGAPVKNIKNANCEYCGISLNEVTTKVWKMASFKDEYNNI